MVEGLADVERATEDSVPIDVASEVWDASLEIACSVVDGICEVSPAVETGKEYTDVAEGISEDGSVVVPIVDDGGAELVSVALAIYEEGTAELVSAVL